MTGNLGRLGRNLLGVVLVLLVSCAGEPSAEYDGRFTQTEARHLLRRAAFGATDQEVDRAVREGLARTVERLLDFRSVDALERRLFRRCDPFGVYTCPEDTLKYWVSLLIESPNPLQERMALYWHDRFATSLAVLDRRQQHYMKDHIDLLRREGLGSYRELLLKLGRDPAMLVWLDGALNTKFSPNENYAREFWELFTLGVDNGYTQQDVEEAARAFTGWVEDRRRDDQPYRMVFLPEFHDAGSKTIFGVTASFDDADVVDLTLRQTQARLYVARGLLEYFAYPDPEPELVQEMADFLEAGGWRLRPLVHKILTSNAMFDARAFKSQVRGPIEFVVGLARSSGYGLQLDRLELVYHLFRMGQIPLVPPSVKGWDEGLAWATESALVGRINFLARATEGAAPASAVPPASLSDAGSTAEWVAEQLGVALSVQERERLVDYLSTVAREDGGVERIRFNAQDPRHQVLKLGGLYFVLGQHPDANRQ